MTGQALIDALDPLVSPATKFAFPSAKEAGVGTARWTDWSPPTFAATVKPASVQDLQAVVKYATEQDVPFLAVASGHGYSPAFGKAKDVLEIDLNGFKDVTVNADANTITIGGAVLHSEVIDPLWKAGKQMRM
jgi:FAD/FMN-containing dehydrogenase